MKSLAIAFALALSCAGALADGMPQPEPEAGPHLALLNGSVVQIVPSPDGRVTIVYVRPRPGLWGKVLPGAVLAQGQWQGDQMQATVYGYNPCGFIPYPVVGSINADGVLTLVGQSPLIDNVTCQVVGQEWGFSSTLALVPMPPQQ